MSLTKKELLELPIIDQLKLAIEESLIDHKKHMHKEYWRGSAYMGENILNTITKLKEANNIK